jgi:hypothetical protein
VAGEDIQRRDGSTGHLLLNPTQAELGGYQHGQLAIGVPDQGQD